MRASIVKPRYNTRNKDLALNLLRHMAKKNINPNLASDPMLDYNLTLSERNEKMTEAHAKEIMWNKNQLQTLLPLQFMDRCFVISVDTYIPLPIQKLDKEEQIKEHTLRFKAEMEKLPDLRPLFVQCSFRIPLNEFKTRIGTLEHL